MLRIVSQIIVCISTYSWDWLQYCYGGHPQLLPAITILLAGRDPRISWPVPSNINPSSIGALLTSTRSMRSRRDVLRMGWTKSHACFHAVPMARWDYYCRLKSEVSRYFLVDLLWCIWFRRCVGGWLRLLSSRRGRLVLYDACSLVFRRILMNLSRRIRAAAIRNGLTGQIFSLTPPSPPISWQKSHGEGGSNRAVAPGGAHNLRGNSTLTC